MSDQSSVVKKIARFVKGIANALKEQDKEAGAVAAKMMELVDRALGSEVEGEKTGEKYEIKYPNFKDEEIERNIKTVVSMKSIITIGEDKLKTTGKAPSVLYEKYFKSLGENIYSKIYGDIAVKKSSVKSEIRHGNTAEKIASMEAIPSVIEKGKVISKYNKGAGVERFVIGAPITIGKTDYLMGVMLQRDAQNQRLYLHNVILKEKTINSQEVDLLTTGTYDENDRLFITSLLQKVLSVNTSDKKSSDKEQYDLDPEAVEREAKRLTPKTEKTEKKKAESSTSGIKTGSAEAGRYAQSMRNEFGLDKKFEAAIRSKLESLEEVFIKGDREAYVEEYKKRVEEIFDIVRREGVVEVATDNSYRGFLWEALYFKFNIEHLFLWLVLFLGVWWELAFGGSCYNTFYFYLSRVF